MTAPRVLIVEDDVVTAKAYELLLSSHLCEVRHAPDFKTAMEQCRLGWPEVILLDIQLPIEDITGIGAWNGMDFLVWVRTMTSNPPQVFVVSSQAAPDAVEKGAAGVFLKPISKQHLVNAVFRGVGKKGSQITADAGAPVQTARTAQWVLKEDQLQKGSPRWLSWLGSILAKR